jgi:hypothetical protein
MVDLAEGCLVMKTVHYSTNQLAHMVNAVRISDDHAHEVVSILSISVAMTRLVESRLP